MFKYITCLDDAVGGISTLFKYITCVGSRKLKQVELVGFLSLNTSHVSVQGGWYSKSGVKPFCLNTSHVSVQGV